MGEKWRQRAKSALRVAWVLYTLLLTAIVFTGFGAFLDNLLGAYRLVVINEAALKAIDVTYSGRAVQPKPGFLPGRVPAYVTFAPMRESHGHEPVLNITWETQAGERRSVSRSLPIVDDPSCLFVLRIDASGDLFDFSPPDRFSPLERLQRVSPFWWNCYRR